LCSKDYDTITSSSELKNKNKYIVHKTFGTPYLVTHRHQESAYESRHAEMHFGS